MIARLRRTAMAGGAAYFQCARQASAAGRRLRRQFLAATMLLAATACSTADYGKPINDFAAATAEAETVLAELNTQLVEGYGAVLENSVSERAADWSRAKAGDCLAVRVDPMPSGNT